jgi:hypothetical protein
MERTERRYRVASSEVEHLTLEAAQEELEEYEELKYHSIENHYIEYIDIVYSK